MMVARVIYKKEKWIKFGIIGIGVFFVIFSTVSTINLLSKYVQLNTDLTAIEGISAETPRANPIEIFEDINLNRIVFESISETTKVADVTVTKINTPFVFKDEGHLVLTEEITLEGGFVNILRCIDLADQKLGLVKISSLKFERNDSQKSKSLFLKVYFQVVKTNDDAR